MSNAIHFQSDWDSDLSKTLRATIDDSASVKVVQELWKPTGVLKTHVNVFTIVEQPEQAAMEFALCVGQEARSIDCYDGRTSHYVEVGDVNFFFDVQ